MDGVLCTRMQAICIPYRNTTQVTFLELLVKVLKLLLSRKFLKHPVQQSHSVKLYSEWPLRLILWELIVKQSQLSSHDWMPILNKLAFRLCINIFYYINIFYSFALFLSIYTYFSTFRWLLFSIQLTHICFRVFFLSTISSYINENKQNNRKLHLSFRTQYATWRRDIWKTLKLAEHKINL